ncbi:MAG: DNA-binding ATPase Uup [Pseudomonadota bacterium]|jgi:ATP-binding cassette subfamily F protein uup
MAERLHARGIEHAHGGRAVLRGVDLSVQDGERIGLVGVNGSGKSTLVRILSGALEPHHGEVQVKGRLATLTQDPELPGETVADALDEAIAWHAALVRSFEEALAQDDVARAGAAQERLDQVGWEVGYRVEALCSRIGVPARGARIADLSGGERRRLALVRALLDSPDVLLLDEPTNHLDADTVEWLQDVLVAHRGALVLVTHDRYLLEAVATRIVEIEDGEAVSYPGSYADYLLARAERRAALERAEDSRLAMIAREAEWASRSPAAQTVKQKARLERLAALVSQRPLMREQRFDLDLRTGLKHGGTVLELHGARIVRGGRVLVRDGELALRAGDRVGILGPNGAGKSTLLRVLSGLETVDRGQFVRGSRVRAAMLDQARSGLDPDATVFEAAGGGNDQVRVGDRWIHVASFLGRFLFGREFHGRRVRELSGGERARLLLAKILLEGANLLMLDEPTNDLDLPTLQVLEEALMAYDGVVLVVTHDRAFLDRVCNAVLVFHEDGRLVRYASRTQVPTRTAPAAPSAPAPTRPRAPSGGGVAEGGGPPSAPASVRPGKLAFREQRELADLPARITALEAQQAVLAARLADPATYRDGTDVPSLARELATCEAAIEHATERWAELASRA